MEELIRKVWEHPAVSWVLGLGFLSATIFFLLRTPKPGVAIAVLGSMAVIMSFRSSSSYGKVLWTVMAFALLFVEIRAIGLERKVQDAAALEAQKIQGQNFLALSKSQDKELLATAELNHDFGSLKENLDKQFHLTAPVKKFEGNPISRATPTKRENGDTVNPPTGPVNQAVEAPHAGALLVTQSPDTSTRADAPVKVKVVIQSTVDFPRLKLVMKCDGPIVEAEGHPARNGMMMMTSQGVSNADRSVWFIQYESATPEFGPDNPMVVDVWAATPIVCNAARTF